MTDVSAAPREPAHIPAPAPVPVAAPEAPAMAAAPQVAEVAPAAPVEQARVQPAPQPAVTPNPVELERALKESGLTLIQTRSDVQVEMQPEPEFIPAKRERKPSPAGINEPLVQVETRRE